MRGMLEQVERQLERGDGMMRRGGRLELIRGVTTECQQLEETGPVHLVRIEAEGGAGREIHVQFAECREQYPWESQRGSQA